MFVTWDDYAKFFESIGEEVNWEEEFFICPECGEPIYKEDWYYLPVEGVDEIHPDGVACPVCGSLDNGIFN